MDRLKLRKLITQRTKDYSYAIAFFFTFSFFVLFVIRPNLVNVFGSFAQIEELKKVENVYDEQIKTILLIQADMEQYRPQLELVNQAVPSTPVVNKVISDLTLAAEKHAIGIDTLEVQDINLKSANERQIEAIKVAMECRGTFEEIHNFLTEMRLQRRLKSVKELVIARDLENVATDSADLVIKMQIEGYYL